jgi:hypothetical protein
VLALLVGCYDPAVDDCQFRCSTQGDCPDGTRCMGQFCRTTGATGQCMTPDPCPSIAPPAGCAGAMKFALDGGGCGVVCAMPAVESGDLDTACAAPWKPGKLDTIMELDAAPISDRTWLGVERSSGEFVWTGYGDQVPNMVWDNGQPSGGGEDCAYLDHPKQRLRNDRACDTQQAYICTTP